MRFPEAEVRGLSPEQRELLVAITALGLSTSRGELDALGAPVLSAAEGDRLAARLRAEVALERAGVDDSVLEARYQTSPAWELEVRHLVRLSPRGAEPESREVARRVAEDALGRIRAGAPFPEVAGEFSEEPGAAARGGLLAPGREGTWVREFWNAAIALEVSEVSGIVETEYGFHVLQLHDRRPVPFLEARTSLAMEVAAMLDDQTAWEAWVAEHAERGVPVELARARGITLDPSEEAQIRRAWERTIRPIVHAFGFEEGLDPDEIRRRALRALGATNQNARIARSELAALAPHLARIHPVRDHRGNGSL